MDRPILFNPQMVRAVLGGKKTQTRRIIKPMAGYGPPSEWANATRLDTDGSFVFWGPYPVATEFAQKAYPNGGGVKCPYGKPGDHLYVREAWWECTDNNDRIYYAATETPENTDRRHYRKRPSIHMPRLASRIALEIIDIRVERLQQISQTDAAAEGITSRRVCTGDIRTGLTDVWSVEGRCDAHDARESYELLWESINGPGSWGDNPWVWVVSFRVV